MIIEYRATCFATFVAPILFTLGKTQPKMAVKKVKQTAGNGMDRMTCGTDRKTGKSEF